MAPLPPFPQKLTDRSSWHRGVHGLTIRRPGTPNNDLRSNRRWSICSSAWVHARRGPAGSTIFTPPEELMTEFEPLIDRYIESWNETDPQRRRDVIARTWT